MTGEAPNARTHVLAGSIEAWTEEYAGVTEHRCSIANCRYHNKGGSRRAMREHYIREHHGHPSYVGGKHRYKDRYPRRLGENAPKPK